MEGNKLDLGTTNYGELNVLVHESIMLDGIEYKPKFSTEGIDIPTVMTTYSEHNGRILGYKVMYQRIPKNVIVDMLKEYIPEILGDFMR